MFENFGNLNSPAANGSFGGMPSTTAMNPPMQLEAGMPTGIDAKTSMWASILGQMGSALSPKDSWQSKLGAVGAGMGSQRLQQMAAQAAEKRQMEFYKKLFENKSPTEVAQTMTVVSDPKLGPVGDIPSATPATIGAPISGSMNTTGYVPESTVRSFYPRGH